VTVNKTLRKILGHLKYELGGEMRVVYNCDLYSSLYTVSAGRSRVEK
jgi:hypothetical protein